jgi:hypothetical protein
MRRGKLKYSTVIPGTAANNPATSYNNTFNASGIVADGKGQVTIGGSGYIMKVNSAGLPRY